VETDLPWKPTIRFSGNVESVKAAISEMGDIYSGLFIQ
jgi:hypothetical protein